VKAATRGVADLDADEGTLVGALVGALASAVVAAAYHHPAGAGERVSIASALAAVGAIVGAIVGALVGARRRGAAIAEMAIAHHRRARTVSVDVTRVDDTRVDAAQARRRICRLAAGLELARCTAGAEWGPMNEEDGDRAQILRLRESAILAGVRGLA